MAPLRIVSTDGESDTLAHANTIAEPRSVRAENAYTVEPGTLLSGKYRVVRTLGRGGMGLVVEAFHLELQIPVAIKLLLPDLMEYTEAASRFQREARAVIKLTSPHIARVLDVDALPSGEPFIVMEYLKGRDLAQRGRDAIPLSVSEAVDCIVQACDALAEAHSLGIVHRDIKPANLFMVERPDGDPVIKVLDFGVSKVLTGDTGEVSITHTTTILGSALYMSPEQMRSAKNVDARTDIYALGACLYEMLARRPPYIAGSFAELCAAVFSGPPMPITEWSPDVPEGLARVIEKALAHEPDARYADVPELVHALAPFAQDATRARIETILRKHASHMTLPPLARRRRSLEPVFKNEEEPSESGRSGSRWLVAALIAVALGGAAVAFRSRLPWPALRGTVSATAGVATSLSPPLPPSTPPPPTSGQAFSGAGPSSTAAASSSATGGPAASEQPTSAPGAPASNTAAPSATVSNTSSPATPVSAAPKPSGTVPVDPAGHTAAPRPPSPPATSPAPPSKAPSAPSAPAPPEPPAPKTAPPPPPANNDLVDQTCYAIQPDGTKKVVPCN